ncbi:MAG: tRNA dihydrouridine synthase DusB [Gammaproteobacteria bacterium]|nr:MAG: tRNA dihydrouridine synthase DusB [Gammaproteobacteria bacterium]
MPTIGSYHLKNKLILAPMAGITDLPFRLLCRNQGAAMAVSEMVTSDPKLWQTRKSKFRLDHTGESSPISVQIAGSDPSMLAEAARLNVANGAQIIDINMGCPAKKVCNRAAGSALMRDERRVKEILHAVVNAVDVPVTLKIRTGWDQKNRNAPTIARIAEEAGIQAIAIHGRTRACGYSGEAEYDTIAEAKSKLQIPVFANGDIDSAEKARKVLNHTSADGLLIGRAAQGKPWIFREIDHYLDSGRHCTTITNSEIKSILLAHIQALHLFYGESMGIRVARKHLGWYLKAAAIKGPFRKHFNRLEDAQLQIQSIEQLFNQPSRHTKTEKDTR